MTSTWIFWLIEWSAHTHTQHNITHKQGKQAHRRQQIVIYNVRAWLSALCATQQLVGVNEGNKNSKKTKENAAKSQKVQMNFHFLGTANGTALTVLPLAALSKSSNCFISTGQYIKSVQQQQQQ